MVEFAKMIDSLSDDLHFSLSNQAKVNKYLKIVISNLYIVFNQKNMNVEQIENELKQSFTVYINKFIYFFD